MNENLDWMALYARGRAATERRHRLQVYSLYTMGGFCIGITLLLIMFAGTAPPTTVVAPLLLLLGSAMLASGRWSQKHVPPGNPVVLHARVQRKYQLSRFWLLELEIAEAVRVAAVGTAEPYIQALSWQRVPVTTAIGQTINSNDEIWLLCTPEGYGVERLLPGSPSAVHHESSSPDP
jgi:hypothetical protein